MRRLGHCDTACGDEHGPPCLALALGELCCEGASAQAQGLGHTSGRQRLGHSDGLRPQGLGNAGVGRRAALAPVLALGGALVEWVSGVSRGVDLHHGLPVIGFLSLLEYG